MLPYDIETTKKSNAGERPQKSPRQKKGLHIKTYGCQMNVYDSERMAGLLRPLGYELQGSATDADLVILNTCHIREKAAEKVYSELGRLRQEQKRQTDAGREMKIAVAGCVAQAEGAEIKTRAPYVDLVFGPQSYHRLPEMIARSARDQGEVIETDFAVEEKFDHLDLPRQVEGVTAFVTIQEGCDKFCRFCVVPYTRGAEVSRSVDSITSEIRALAAQGVREVTLLGQNVNAYRGLAPIGAANPTGNGIITGKDNATNSDTTGLSDKSAVAMQRWGLGALVRHIAKIDGIERLRFTTSHPQDMDEALIEAIGSEAKLMPYLHLPVQAGSDKILKAMNRGHSAETYIRLIERIRRARPDIAISGDFIVGFPGETDADFQETIALVKEVGYASAFSFKYSRRPGTPGATLPDQISETVKSARLALLQDILESQKQHFNAAQIGRELPVLFTKRGRKSGQIVGLSPYLQSVHIKAGEELIGEIQPVRIEACHANSLAATLP